MDELWQRYRTFWTPLLIGVGAFLVGVIVVHILSESPDQASKSLRQAETKLSSMRIPGAKVSGLLRQRAEVLRGENRVWSRRLNQTGAEQVGMVASAAEQALRASILRGAPESEARDPERLRARFDDDEVAAANAYRRFLSVVEQHKQKLSSGDPNVAFGLLLGDVWADLRERANRADVETDVEQLGFGTISSVNRATLPGRVLNLALVARVVDVAIRHQMHSILSLEVPAQIDPGNPEDFVLLLPVELVMVGDMSAVKQVMDMLTDPEHPTPIDMARLAQPKRGSGTARGLVELTVKASSAIVRPDVDLKLDVEEEE